MKTDLTGGSRDRNFKLQTSNFKISSKHQAPNSEERRMGNECGERVPKGPERGTTKDTKNTK
jgi:hypothetical protein